MRFCRKSIFISNFQGEVRAQDSVFVIVAVAINPKGRDMAWEFFKENNKQLLERYQVGVAN